MPPITSLVVTLLTLIVISSSQGNNCFYNNLTVQTGVTGLTTGCQADSSIANEGWCHYSMGSSGYYTCPSSQCVSGVWNPTAVQCRVSNPGPRPHTAENQIVVSVNPAILSQYGLTAPEVQWVERLASFIYISRTRIQASRLTSTDLLLIIRQTDCTSQTCDTNQICTDTDGILNSKFTCTCIPPKTGMADDGFAECAETVVGDCVDSPCGNTNLQECVDTDSEKNGQFECRCSPISGVTGITSRNMPATGCGTSLLRNNGYSNTQVISSIVEESRCCPNSCMSSRGQPSGYCTSLGVLGVSTDNVCISFPTRQSCQSLTSCSWDASTSRCITASGTSSDDSVSAGVWVALVAIVVITFLGFVAAVCWWRRVNAVVDKRTNSPPREVVSEIPQPGAPIPDFESIPIPSVSHLPSISKHPAPPAPPAPPLPISERNGGSPFFETSAAEQPANGETDLSILRERKHPSVYSSMWDG